MEYELIFIIPLEQERNIELIKNEISEIISSAGGKLLSFTDIGKRKFAYPINHQTHGYYSYCRFFIENRDAISTINKEILIKKKVVRHMIVRADEIGKPVTEKIELPVEKKPVESEQEEVDITTSETSTLADVSEKDKKIELSKLDQKLDEILESTEN